MKNPSPSPSSARRILRPARRPAKRGSLSIFAEIKKDHAVFRKAMERIRKLYPSDAESAKAAYSEFRAKLHAHARAEEDSLYPYLLGKTEPGEKLDDQVREGKEEHHLADFLLNELDQIPAADPKWKAKFRVLQESVEHHLDEEEDYFKAWRRRLSEAENRLVLAHFVSRRSAILGQALAARH